MPGRKEPTLLKPLLDGADLKLGLFAANCSSGLAVTKISDRWQGEAGFLGSESAARSTLIR